MTSELTEHLKPKFHRDGTVTYWSVFERAWLRTDNVPDRELAAMPWEWRERVIRHLEQST